VIRRADQVLRNPTALVVLLCAGQIVAWTLAPALTHSAPPLDVVEGYMWGREWVIATFKHPALPSWVLETSRILTGGAVGWPAYLVSQLFVAATFIFAFLLGRDMMGASRGAAATLLLTGIAFYAWPTPEFNHNVAETPFWAALPWALWRAVERRGTAWWLLVGALGGVGLYAKLTTALLLVTLAAWIVWDERARQCLRTPGPWIGLAISLAIAAPLAIWLVTHDFLPLKYAAERSGQSQAGNAPIFVASLALNLVGVWIMLTIAGLVWPWRRFYAGHAPPEPPPPPVPRRALAYLVVLTTGPLSIAILAALVSGSGLRSAWGSPMFNLAGILAIALTSKRFDSAALRRLAVCAAFLIVVVPLAYAAVVVAGPSRAGAPVRVTWPQAAIAERLAGVWERETRRPLRIVSGDDWVAGLVGLTAKDRPSILNRGNLAYSPWITPERIEREGMLIVWDAASPKISLELLPYVVARPRGEERFERRRTRRGNLTIAYVVVPPK
jgi:4-amino-4-deoxy-L-arabinose transferase-like glycosyltransferase